MARLQRRTSSRSGSSSSTVELGGCGSVASELELTPKEFDLLTALARDPGAVLSRRRLLEEVWETSWYGSTKTIDVHVASLRRKLGDPDWIETVRGVGFRLRT